MKFFYTHKKIFLGLTQNILDANFFHVSGTEANVTSLQLQFAEEHSRNFQPVLNGTLGKGHLPWDLFHASKLDIKVVSRPPTSLMARFLLAHK